MECSKPKAHKCSVCSKDASLICKGCKDTPNCANGLTAVYYCNAACQSSAWANHKVDCKIAKDRRALYRAGDIAQELWFTFQKNTWMWSVDRLKKDGNNWQVFDGQCSGKSIVVPFPTSVFPEANDQKSIMSYNSCNAAIAHIHRPLGDMLQGIDKPTCFHPTQLTGL